MFRLIFFSCLFLSFETYAYKFVCNGVLAEGHVRNDSCGECSDEYAARWLNPNVPVVVDFDQVPPYLSKIDWAKIVHYSFDVWNSVEGSDFRFVPLNRSSLRNFGSNETIHEIYWVVDPLEWRMLVGFGEFGTLGATLPKYNCGGDLGQSRVIFDADMILNGVEDLNWQVDCEGKEDCLSIVTTLVHELGHMLGLDHPCMYCEDSVMSARAGNNLTKPTRDDINGLLALYSVRNNTEGTFGDLCVFDNDCAQNFSCIEDKGQRICSNSCHSNSDCETNNECSIAENNNSYCIFPNPMPYLGAALYEECEEKDCMQPLVCAGVKNSNYHCFSPCIIGYEGCSLGSECVALDFETAICVPVSDLGGLCNKTTFCRDDLFCLFNDEENGYCSKSCLTSADCGLEQDCVRIENNLSLCISKEKPSSIMPAPLNVDSSISGFNKKNISNGRFFGCSSLTSGHFSQILFIFGLLAFFRTNYSFRIKKLAKRFLGD